MVWGGHREVWVKRKMEEKGKKEKLTVLVIGGEKKNSLRHICIKCAMSA